MRRRVGGLKRSRMSTRTEEEEEEGMRSKTT